MAFLETAPYGVKTTSQRWLRAVVLGVGGVFGGYFLPKIISAFRAASTGLPATGGGITISRISDMVSNQPLLWDRLFPNSTYPLGVIPALLLAVGPFVILMAIFAKRLPWKLNLWQQLLLFGELIAFLTVGIIVSVKIGGGSNLHNLDMFLITLVLVAGLLWEAGDGLSMLHVKKPTWIMQALFLLMVFYPATRGMLNAYPIELPTALVTTDAIETIQRAVDEAHPGEILFIDQRQLLTFGTIQNVPLIPQYEKKRMMDMAMGDDARYFEPFYADLAAHRFALILSEPLWTSFQGGEYKYGFGNENDAWVKWVSIPVLCYYEPAETNMKVGFQLLVPRTGAFPENISQYCKDIP